MKTDDNMNKPQKLSRKLRKILVEKKRRERIDKCLKQIKDLLFQGTEFQHDYMRMEKADILENVVKFLRCQTLSPGADPHTTETRPTSDYRLGFSHCMREVHQVLEHVCGHSNPLTLSINQYLHNRLNETCLAPTTAANTERLSSQNDNFIKQELISPNSSSAGQNLDGTTSTSTNPTATCSRIPIIHPLHSLELHVGHMTCYGTGVGNPDFSEESFNETIHSQNDGNTSQSSSSGAGFVVGGGEASQVVPSSGHEESHTDNAVHASNSNNNNVQQQQQQLNNELDSNMWRPW